MQHPYFDAVKVPYIILAAVASACAKDATVQREVSGSRYTTRLIDTLDRSEGQDAPYYRIEIRGPAIDTIKGVWTTDQPTIVGDSVAVGTLSDTTASRKEFFRYFLVSRRLERLRMPEQFSDPLSDIQIAPDGALFAWAAFDHNGNAAAEIHRFPSAELVSRSPSTAVSPSDGRLGIGEWTSATTARIHVWAYTDSTRPWMRFSYDRKSDSWKAEAIRNGQ
jgi:hypothetical protein